MWLTVVEAVPNDLTTVIDGGRFQQIPAGTGRQEAIEIADLPT